MIMRVFHPHFHQKKDEGVSLIEVVVSMVILSIVTAFVASFVAGSIRSIARSDGTTTAAAIAQEQMDRLLAVPIKQWGYDRNGNLNGPVESKEKKKDGITYTVRRELSRNASDLDIKDTCKSVVGTRVSRADMVVVKITVRADTGPYRDSYTATSYVARDGNVSFLNSSVTIRFNVDRGAKKSHYREGGDGDPIRVNIKDRFRNNQGRGEDNHIPDGLTKDGCVTFLGLKGKSPWIKFEVEDYILTTNNTNAYEQKVNMISGGHRELVFDLKRTSDLTVVPDIVGVPRNACGGPKLVRLNTPIDAPKNRALTDIRDVAKVSAREARRIEGISEAARTPAEKARLLSYNRKQYYLVCQDRNGPYQNNDYRYWFLLPDTIPISVEQEGEVRAVEGGSWSNTTFQPLHGSDNLVEVADAWPKIKVSNPKVGGEGQRIFAGSCLMQDPENQVQPELLTKTKLNSNDEHVRRVHVRMWAMPLEGWYKPEPRDANYISQYKGFYPLVLKAINDTEPTTSMWGDGYIAPENERLYKGCKQTPVFDAGWLRAVSWKDDFAQMRIALPYGLYAYSMYNPTETEDVDGQDLTQSRNTCYPQQRSDRLAGERTCLRAGAPRITHLQSDVRVPYRPAHWSANNYKFFYDWAHPEKGHYPLPRGPILDACEANTGDFRYCKSGGTKDPNDPNQHTGNDDKHPPGQQPGFGPTTPPAPPPPPVNPPNPPPGPSDPNKGVNPYDPWCWQFDANNSFTLRNICGGSNRFDSGIARRWPPRADFRECAQITHLDDDDEEWDWGDDDDIWFENHCTGREGPYPNGRAKGSRPQPGTWEDDERCWLSYGKRGKHGYNYCTDYRQKKRYKKGGDDD